MDLTRTRQVDFEETQQHVNHDNDLEGGDHTFHHPQLGTIVEDALAFLQNSPELHLPLQKTVEGAGVYALYYGGCHPLYSCIPYDQNSGQQLPIYVGKAVPKGWRQGLRSESAGTPLRSRIAQHAKSIHMGKDLACEDFTCRYLVLEGEMLPLIAALESQFISRFRPIWNSCVDGFGNHDPGSGRYHQVNSEWDTIHPGRPWGSKMPPNPLSEDDIILKGHSYLKNLT